MTVVYYIKAPNGRRKITPTPANDEEAIRAFNSDWTATANWACDGERVLVKETKEAILTQKVKMFVNPYVDSTPKDAILSEYSKKGHEMQADIQQVVQAIQDHLNSAVVHETSIGKWREPLPPIICNDGTKFSVQAGKYHYCTPQSNTGPWTKVEVMTITAGVTPQHWFNDADDNLAGYVPIELVAQEIISRGNLRLTDDRLVLY